MRSAAFFIEDLMCWNNNGIDIFKNLIDVSKDFTREFLIILLYVIWIAVVPHEVDVAEVLDWIVPRMPGISIHEHGIGREALSEPIVSRELIVRQRIKKIDCELIENYCELIENWRIEVMKPALWVVVELCCLFQKSGNLAVLESSISPSSSCLFCSENTHLW